MNVVIELNYDELSTKNLLGIDNTIMIFQDYFVIRWHSRQVANDNINIAHNGRAPLYGFRIKSLKSTK